MINTRKVEIALRSEILEAVRKTVGGHICTALNVVDKQTNNLMFNIEIEVIGNFKNLFKISDSSIIKKELQTNIKMEIINKKSEN